MIFSKIISTNFYKFKTMRVLCMTFERLLYVLLLATSWKRNVVYANRSLVYNENPRDSQAFYRQMLKHLTHHIAEILFDFAKFKKLPRDTQSYPYKKNGTLYELAPMSKEVLLKMREGGIFLTAHYGNYEAIGPWLCRLGIPLKASYIPLKPSWLNQLVESRLRSVNGQSYAVNARSPRDFLRLLDQKQLFCLLADQDSRVASAEKGKLLGQDVHVNPLPDFLLKHRPHTPVFVCWLEEYRQLKILHAKELPTENGAIATPYNCWLENRINENPALWYSWTHRRFYSCKPQPYSKLE